MVGDNIDSKIDLKTLLHSDWQELRTELVEWDDCGHGIEGFDGLTRYWCAEAVFDIYWIAEREPDSDFDVYFGSDWY